VAILGSARVSRAGFGVHAETIFEEFRHLICSERTRQVRNGEDAIANTRDACAPQNIAFETSG
jgi:hypothetical protein